MANGEIFMNHNYNTLKLFNHPKFGKIRVLFINGEPWFVTTDACKCLGLTNVTEALRNLDEDEKGFSIFETLGGPQKMSIVSESGLYSLILRSRKPEAKELKKWVTHEILPLIRKTGSYYVANINSDVKALENKIDN